MKTESGNIDKLAPKGTSPANLDKLVAKGFKRLRYIARPSDVAKVAEALRAQELEYDEVAVSAACVGYLVAKGAFFTKG